MEHPTRIGRYEVVEFIARGGMGVLYRGRDTVLDREVAIKLMAADVAAEEQSRTRFYREARAAAKLQHRNIVTVFEFGEEDGTPFMAMEFLRGADLGARMRVEPPLDLERKVDILSQVCTGLHFAHQQSVVHRDIKPGNIWLLEDGGVKLLDFGIAKVAASTITRSTGVLGTASYMSPEQVAGKPVDGRSDIFSAGVVLYELLSGRKPFDSDAPTSVLLRIIQEDPPAIDTLVPGLPEPLIAIVHRALQKDPDKRYTLASDMASDLQIVRLSLQQGGETVVTTSGLARTVWTDRVPELAVTGPDVPPDVAGELELGVRPSTAPHPRSGRTMLVGLVGVAVAIALVTTVLLFGGKRRDNPPPAASTPAETRVPATVPAALPTPAVTPPTHAVVRITSDPDGASIAIDGHDTGLVTPNDVRVAPGTRPRVVVSKRGYRPAEARLSDTDLQAGRLDLTLPREETVPVTITGTYPFEVLENGRVISAEASSHSFTTTGPRTLRLRAPEYFLDRVVEVQPGNRRRIDLDAPELGRLTVRTSLETCNVAIGDRSLGFPPIVDQPIVAGSHVVSLSCPDGDRRQVRVVIAPGEPHLEIIK